MRRNVLLHISEGAKSALEKGEICAGLPRLKKKHKMNIKVRICV